LVGHTDPRGRLELPPLQLGRDRLLVRAPGYREHRERERLRRGQKDGILEISLSPAEIGSVTLFLPEGAPAGRIPIRVVGTHGVNEGITDRHGVFSYPLEDAEHRIEVDLDGFAVVRELALPPQQTIDLVRAPERTLLLTDARHLPVAGAEVTITLPDRTRFARTSGPRGEVRFPAPQSDAAIHFEIAHPEHPIRVLERPHDAHGPIAIELADGAWIEGVIEGPSGRASGGVVLAVPTDRFFARDVLRATIDGEGHYRLGPLLPVEALLRIEADGLAAAEIAVTGLHPFETLPLDVTLSRGSSVEGRVVTPAGAPLPGVRVQIGAVFGDEVRGPIVESDGSGRFRIDGLPEEAPPLRRTVPETRWSAFGDPKSVDGPERGLLLQVHAPHQLQAVDGEELPRLFFLGSRNTVAITREQQFIELVVDPWPDQHLPRVELVDPDGFPLRDVVNWLVLPAGDPSDRSRIFAGTDGNPVNVRDAAPLGGCWVGLIPRRHAVTGRVLRLADDDVPWTVELWPRIERTITFRHDDGSPHAGAELWWIPRSSGEPNFAALALGRTDETGTLSVDFLAPGEVQIVETAPRTKAPQPIIDAIALEQGRVIGVLKIPRAGGTRLEMRVHRAPENGGE
jgi:hypothetical protein